MAKLDCNIIARSPRIFIDKLQQSLLPGLGPADLGNILRHGLYEGRGLAPPAAGQGGASAAAQERPVQHDGSPVSVLVILGQLQSQLADPAHLDLAQGGLRQAGLDDGRLVLPEDAEPAAGGRGAAEPGGGAGAGGGREEAGGGEQPGGRAQLRDCRELLLQLGPVGDW